MDFRQLEAFCAIVECGNFSNAAKHLYITQPTISNHIHNLEEELNTILFKRTTKTLSLSTDGKQLYEYAKNLLCLRDKAIRNFDRTKTKKLQLGASSIPSAYIIPELLSAYKKTHSNLLFEVIQSDSNDIIEQLKSGNLDIAITGTPISDEQFYCSAIYNDEMVLVTPYNSEFSNLKKDNICITKLLEYPYIVRENGSGTKLQAELFLQSLGLDHTSLNIVAQMNDLEAIKQSVIYGLGVSILSKRVISDAEKENLVLSFPLDKDGVYRDYYLIYRKDHIINKRLMNFISFAKGFYQQK